MCESCVICIYSVCVGACACVYVSIIGFLRELEHNWPSLVSCLWLLHRGRTGSRGHTLIQISMANICFGDNFQLPFLNSARST